MDFELQYNWKNVNKSLDENAKLPVIETLDKNCGKRRLAKRTPTRDQFGECRAMIVKTD
jgi:hypothetical protein